MKHQTRFMADTTLSFTRLSEGPLAVAVSGGVDSLCALLLAVRSGRPVRALHARLAEPSGHEARCEALQTEARLARVCAELGTPLHVVDLRERFAALVTRPFARAWADGVTPNPCTLCNRRIKFGLFQDEAARLGCTGLVTGHYVRLDYDHPYRGAAPLLGPAADARKDQSYFLGLVPRLRLARAAFPLAGLEKDRVRALVTGAGLAVPQPKESQDICFVPRSGGGYRDAVAALDPESAARLAGEGDIVEASSGRVIGRHRGLWRYTEGQRQGLGIAWTEPLYVVGRRAGDNVLLVGGRSLAVTSRADLTHVNFMVEPDELPAVCLVRLRYRQTPMPARAAVTGAGLSLRLAEPVFMSAPGQTGVVLDAERRVLAAGVITSAA